MVRRALLPAVCAATVMFVSSFEAEAACRIAQVIGLWDRENGTAQLRFFSNNRLDCRLCDPKYGDGCRFIPDAADDQGRKQCSFTHSDGRSTTLSNWTARDGTLESLVFADGTAIEVGEGCRIDGKAGVMRIEGLGTFTCNYEYHCRKLERLTR